MNKELSGFRAIFFPIYRHELKKFLPLCFMMFFVLFNYYILRDTKDTLIVNAAGAEALSLIKLIGTVPGAILVMLIYSKLSNMLSRENLFYVTLLPFILFFAFFAFLIYPHVDILHPSKHVVKELVEQYPRFKTFFYVYGSWSYGLFYVLSELWGSVVLSLLFWQFANYFVQMDEAKRFYPLFGFIANFGVIVAGWTVHHFSKVRGILEDGIDPWGMTLNYLMTAVTIGGIAIAAIYYWMNRFVVVSSEPSQIKKEKPKLSLFDSFKMLIRSKHLGYIALLLICYGISQNVIEAVWKGQIKLVYINENEYNAFMGRFSMATGAMTILCMLIGSNIVRIFGWFVSACLTPLMIFVTGLIFFSFIFFRNELEPLTMSLFGVGPAVVAVWLGLFQNVISKATKYSLFDPTKEMSYIPLDPESKVKGKAAVDVVGGRLGKSGGSFTQQFLLVLTGTSLVELAPYFACIVVGIIAIWLLANRGLDKSLKEKERSEEMITAG